MAFQLSPGINVSEIDLTTVVPSVATSVGAFAGKFAWGPANTVITISDEVQLVDVFGKPNANTYEHWFSAANFLTYSNNLRVIRAANTLSSKNATGANNGVLIRNTDDYEDNFQTGANTYGIFAAKYFGELGNSIRVEMVDSNTYSGWTHANSFTSAPNTSTSIASRSGLGNSSDELHIIVLDSNGAITGTANTILEKFGFVSKAPDAKNFDGSTLYYKDVINQKSKYIWWLSHPTPTTNSNWGTINTSYTLLTSTNISTLANGASGNITSADIQIGFDKVANPDSEDVSLIITGPATESIVDAAIAIAESRKDCVVFCSPERDDVVDAAGSEQTNVTNYRSTLTSSSFAVMDSGWKYQYDKYNDVYRWVPLNADIAGLCARTDLERDPWFSPAGTNRGVIKNVIKLAWNPTKANRDVLYNAGINPVVTFQGEGTVLFGDKTLLNRPSAFDRINVRRLFITLEKAIARAARTSLFEFNDSFTRAQFVNLIEPYLRDVQGRRGITDFRVVCDETNNTAEVVDRNEFVGDIYIKPARSVNFVQLNFVAVRSGVSFEEIVGRAV